MESWLNERIRKFRLQLGAIDKFNAPEMLADIEEFRKANIPVPYLAYVEALCRLQLSDTRMTLNALRREILSPNPHPDACKFLSSVLASEVARQPKCVIVGQDGYDGCVLTNLMALYTELGFSTYCSRSIESADLVVISRWEEDKPLSDPGLPRDIPIHIFPYVGILAHKVAANFKEHPVSLFAPSRVLMDGVQCTFGAEVLPPVRVPLWYRRGLERSYEFVHIGNFKRCPDGLENWPDLTFLIEALKNDSAHLWGGLGWEQVAGIKNWHKEENVHVVEVPDLYAKTRFALGLMYPYQLERGTFSSRFWQAPLCGAALIAERGIRRNFPGVFSIGLDDLKAKAAKIALTPEEIQKSALLFWDAEWHNTLAAVKYSLGRFPAGNRATIPTGKQLAVGVEFSLLCGGIDPNCIYT
jgi:hypothetical protein